MHFPVEINAVSGSAVPAFKGTFSRVNVILGENGVGKSRLLLHLLIQGQQIFGNNFLPVRVEGGRAIAIPVNVGMEHRPDVFSNPEMTAKTYIEEGRSSSLSSRVQTTFLMLRALENAEKIRHSDAVIQWQKGDQKAPMPERRTPPFERFVRMFQSVFPALSVVVSTHNQLFVRQGNQQYSADGMSDGEKQVFILLADIAILERGHTLFLIDEPELNLHPELAIALWQMLEQLHTSSIFIYATHSLGFALRGGVDAVWCLPHGQISFANGDLQNVNLRPFLGAIGGILKSNVCLFVEGEDGSFDRPFYRWLLGRDDVEVIPVGSSSEVIAAVGRRSVWNQISPSVKVAGVIDGDYGSKRNLEGIASVVQLPVREVEALLCNPAIVVALSERLNNTGRQLDKDDITTKLADVAEKTRLKTVAQRVFNDAKIDLAVSLERKAIGGVKSSADLRAAILLEAKNERAKADILLSEAKLGELFDGVDKECHAAIASRDTEAMLKLFDGKRALSELCKLAGCPSPVGMLHAVRHHFRPEQFEALSILRQSILAAIQ